MNSNKDWTRFWKFVAAIALALSTLAVTLSGIGVLAPSEEAIARSTYQCAVHTEQGCAKFVVEDGGEVEVQSGGILDIQSGSTFNVGGLYPLLHSADGKQIVCATETITGATSVAHGLTTPLYALCSLGADTSTGAGAAVICTAQVAGDVVTVTLWQDDWASAATVGAAASWCVIGTP